MEYGRPIRVFYGNLLRVGITLRVVDGVLRIGGQGRTNLSPAYRKEITRRAFQLIEILEPPVPDELMPYFHRPLTVQEIEAATNIAKQIGAHIAPFPANGFWILLMRSW